MQLPLSTKRIGGVTLYAAISTGLKHPVYYLGKSTNAVEFREFLGRVKAALKDPSEKAWLLYDGARAHTANKSIDMIK